MTVYHAHAGVAHVLNAPSADLVSLCAKQPQSRQQLADRLLQAYEFDPDIDPGTLVDTLALELFKLGILAPLRPDV